MLTRPVVARVLEAEVLVQEAVESVRALVRATVQELVSGRVAVAKL